MFYFHPIHKKCQKLAFTHPIVVLKSGLKNNWMKKLDHVNRPLGCDFVILLLTSVPRGNFVGECTRQNLIISSLLTCLHFTHRCK